MNNEAHQKRSCLRIFLFIVCQQLKLEQQKESEVREPHDCGMNIGVHRRNQMGDALLRSAVSDPALRRVRQGLVRSKEIYQADPEYKQQSCLGSSYCEVPEVGKKEKRSRKKKEWSERWTLQNVLHSGSSRYGEPQYVAPKTGLSMQILKIGTMKRSVYLTNSCTDLIGNSSQQNDERCQVSKAKAMRGFTDHHPKRKAGDTHGEGLGPGKGFVFSISLHFCKQRREGGGGLLEAGREVKLRAVFC